MQPPAKASLRTHAPNAWTVALEQGVLLACELTFGYALLRSGRSPVAPQGIKFYDPSIVGDTPETVELLGLSNVLRLAQRPTSLAGQVPLLLAGGGSALSPFAAEWGALDDIVMVRLHHHHGASCRGAAFATTIMVIGSAPGGGQGGVSESQLTVRKGAGEGGRDAVVFGGVVREENNGGFVSARSRNFSQALDVSAYDGAGPALRRDSLPSRMAANSAQSRC
eukprot:scaffold28_cov515-Prasinococcus_capsulatus_cf.AAC.9